MKVRSLTIEKVAGLDPRGVTLQNLDASVLLVLGPNGAGKSTTRRCLEQLLFQNHSRLRNADLKGVFVTDTELESPEFHSGFDALTAEQRGGVVRWTRGDIVVEAPQLPPPERADCYAIGARELLAAGDSERDFAAAVRREMAGGFDLREVRDDVAGEVFAPRFAVKTASNVRDARARLLQVERTLDALADDEDRLEELREEAATADRDAKERARLLSALEALRAARGRLDPARDTVEQLDSELAQLDERLRAIDGGETLPNAEQLDRVGRRLTELARADEALRNAETAVERAAARERKARAELMGEDCTAAKAPSLKTVQVVEQLWTERDSERRRRDEARARIESLSGSDDAGSLPSMEVLQGAVSDLEQWLSASPVQGRPLPKGLIGAMWGVLVIGIIGAIQIHPWVILVSAAALAVLATFFQLRLQLAPTRVQREQAQDRFTSRGVCEPPPWEQPAVDALARRLREDRERARRRDFDTGERGRAQAVLEQAEARLERIESEMAKLRANAGVRLDGLALVDWAKRMHEWREADLALAEERGEYEHARTERDTITADLAQELELADDESRDAATLGARREALSERIVERDSLTRERVGRVGERDRAATTLERARQELARATKALEVEIDADPVELEARMAPQLDQLGRSADRRDSLLEQVATITAHLEDARRRGEWDEVRAARDVAEQNLEGSFHDRLDAICALSVLQDAEREYERESRPAVLDRAAALFGRFTHQRYELLASEAEGQDPRFAAQDVEAGARRELEELSDGTRMQLLLALRIAFAEQGEKDERVPIVLDEVFSMSDPDRVRSMVDALGDLAMGGRQVIYLGADPALEAAWNTIAKECRHPAPRVVHLERVQQAIRGVAEATQLAIRASHSVPDADTMSAEEFGRTIGVGLLQPFEDAGALHLFHLLRDDLHSLTTLLKQKIDTLGKWERLVDQGGAAKAIESDEVAAILTERAAAARALVDAWHVGRGRTIGRAELEETRAVSENWYDRFEAVLADLHGSASLLLDAVEKEGTDRDIRLKGFRAHKVTALRSYLIEKGHLDPRPLLPVEDQDLRARAAAPNLDAVFVTQLADTLRAQLDAGMPAWETEDEATDGVEPTVELTPQMPPVVDTRDDVVHDVDPVQA